MLESARYRQIAWDCLKASVSADVGSRAILLSMACTWASMADRAELAEKQASPGSSVERKP